MWRGRCVALCRAAAGPAVGRCRPEARASRRFAAGAPRGLQRHRLVHLWADGKVTRWEGSSKELMLLFGLAVRDLRLFATKGSHISIGHEYFLFRLPPYTGCVWSDSVLILSEGNGKAAELFTKCLGQELAAERDEPQPFEFTVLEMALRESFVQKEDRYTRLSALIASALNARAAADAQRLSIRDFLAPSLTRATREHALYKLLMLSNSLAALEVDVKRHESCLENLLKSDEDMAAMYLSYRRDSGNERKVSDHEDVELMLESFGMQLEDLSDKIQKLQESVVTQSKMEQLMLTSERNRIMRLEMLMGMATSSLAVSTLVAGFFGMNLVSGLEEVPGLFWLALTGCTAFSIFLFYGLMAGVRRYHSVQRQHLSEVSSLRNALDALDEAYFELRKPGSLSSSEEEPQSGFSREALFQTLQSAGYVLNDVEQDILWEAMDSDQDGLLSPKELGFGDTRGLKPRQV